MACFWFALLLFVAFVPLLIIANNVTKNLPFWLHVFISSDLEYWHHLLDVELHRCWERSCHYRKQPTHERALAILFFCVAKNKNIGYFTLIAAWLTFEYIHLNWQISWPWLTLGNGFAMHTTTVQWYEYTGVAGGSFWILVMNILVHKLVVAKKKSSPSKKILFKLLPALLFPLFAQT